MGCSASREEPTIPYMGDAGYCPRVKYFLCSLSKEKKVNNYNYDICEKWIEEN